MEQQHVVTDSEQQVAVQKKGKLKHLTLLLLDVQKSKMFYKQRRKNP